MRVKELSLENFRNYSASRINFEQDLTILEGRNAMGKTNIVEALAILSLTKSPRTTHEDQLINNNQSTARVICDFINDSQDANTKNITLVVDKSSARLKKLWRLNKVPKRSTEITGQFITILFRPDDLNLLTSSPTERRNYLDNILIRTVPNFLKTHNRYKKVLRQRLAALDLLREGQTVALEPINTQLAQLGAQISYERSQLVDQLKPFFSEYFNQLDDKSSANLNLINKSFNDLNTQEHPQDLSSFYDIYCATLNQMQAIEVKAGRNLVGPHREDLEIYLNNKLLRDFGSRGEWRSGILALKKSELEYLSKKIKTKPVLLLDDVTSELDVFRQQKLVDWIGEQQTIMTTTSVRDLPEELQKNARVYTVENGTITLKEVNALT